jgi:excisionase family DNA binding protein
MSTRALPHCPAPGGGNHTEAGQLDGLTLTVRLDAGQLAEVAEHVAAILASRAKVERPATSSPYMTVAEAAEYLRADRQRVDDLLSQRRLTRFKDGRRTLVSRAEVEAYLAGVAHTLPTVAQAPSRRGRAT